MQPEDIDGMRRSLAIGGILGRNDVEQLLDACPYLLAKRRRRAHPRRARASWTSTRRTLNELARIVVADNG